jgi:hypothetical protein
MHLPFETALVLAVWLYNMLICVGLGFIILRICNFSCENSEEVLLSFWIGWTFLIGILQIWQMIFPVNLQIALIVMIISAMGLFWNWKSFSTVVFKRRHTTPLLFVIGLLILALAIRATGPITVYDTGLYHLNCIRWNTDFSLVRGLGNLHGRFAFNSSFFLYLSFLDIGPLRGLSHHFGNSLLLLVISMQGLIGLRKLLVIHKKPEAHNFIWLIFVFPITYLCLQYDSDTINDLPLFLLGIIMGVYLWKSIYARVNERDLVYSSLIIILFTAIGTSIKISFAVFGGLSSLIIMGISLKHIFETKKWSLIRKCIIWPVLLSSFIIFPWMLRGVMISGYPAYPISAGSFNVTWKVPQQKAVEMVKTLKCFCREPGVNFDEVFSSWKWLKPWFNHVSHSITFATPLLALILGIILAIFQFVRKGKSYYSLKLLLFFLLPSLISILFWFFTAPDPRYAGALFWLVAAGVLVPIFSQIDLHKNRNYLTALSLCLVVLPILLDVGFKTNKNSWSQTFYTLPKASMHNFITKSKLTVLVPDTGDQCWDSPLPCTPYPDSSLSLINANDINSGFYIRKF